MTVQLSEALRELADDRPPSGGRTHDGEAAQGAWTRSRTVRRRRRVAGATVAVVTALLVVPVASALSAPRAENPLPGEGQGVAGIPDQLYETPDLAQSATGSRGTPAALAFVSRIPQRIAGWAGDGQGAQSSAGIFVSATSDEYRAYPASASFVALSPDGRRAAVVSESRAGSGSDSTLTLMDLVTGSSSEFDWPSTTIDAAAFSPDGTQLAMSVGVLMEGSETARNGHIYVLAADGIHDVANTFVLYGWLPGSREVVVGLGEEGGVRAVSATATADALSRRLGPFVDAGGQGAVSMVSPDGLLVASSVVAYTILDVPSYRLTVTRIPDGTVVRQVEYPDVFGVQVLGWRDATTPVVGVWSNDGTPEGLVVVQAVGSEQTELSRGPAAGGVNSLAAAEDQLSTVRPAGPPEGVAWFTDRRAAAWHVSGWFGMTPRGMMIVLLLVGLVALPVALVLVNNRRVRHRDPEASIR